MNIPFQMHAQRKINAHRSFETEHIHVIAVEGIL